MKKKELKNTHSELTIHLVDILNLLDPSKTNKYTPFLINEFKKFLTNFKNAENPNPPQYPSLSFDHTTHPTPAKTFLDKLYKKSNLLDHYLLDFVLEIMGKENIHALIDFNTHLENKRTKITDISKLESFGDIHEQLVLAELKHNNSKIKKEITTLYDDDEWLIIKPLTYEASKVYGASTKWCTSQRDSARPFYEYSKDGIFLYIINRLTNKKIAVSWTIDGSYIELSWWDEFDRRLDSMQTKLPNSILEKIKELLKSEKLTNYTFFSKKEKNKCENILNKYNFLSSSPDQWREYNQNTETIYDSPNEWRDAGDETNWTISDETGTQSMNIDKIINKTLEYNYTYKSIKKSLEDLNDYPQ